MLTSGQRPEVVHRPRVGRAAAQHAEELADARGLSAASAPERMLGLQGLVGNQAVTQLVSSGTLAALEGEPAEAAKADDGQPDPGQGPAPALAPGPEGGDSGPTSGTLDPIEDEPLEKVGCEAPDAKADGGGPPSVAAGPPGGGPPMPVQVNLSFAYRERQGEVPTGADRHQHGDSVGSTLTLGNKVEKTGAVSPFGAEYVTYKVDNISWSAAAGKVTISARVFLDITWNTNSGGNTPVDSANDAAVTAGTWKAIADDLKPNGTGRPTRATYWAPALTEKHEKFHSTDDIGRATLYLPTAKSDLDSKTIAAPADAAKVKALLETMKDKVKADGWAWYNAGGEDRAYADGKSSYQALSDAITAKAASKGWTP